MRWGQPDWVVLCVFGDADAWVRGRSGLGLLGGVDVVVGVENGFGEVHRCPSADALIDCLDQASTNGTKVPGGHG